MNHDYYDHPVFHPRRLHLQTPAKKALRDEIHRWLWTGTTGAAILGASRVGKTTALEELSSDLWTRGGVRIPTDYTSTPPRDQQTIASVFRQVCWNVGLSVKDRDKADYLSDRYVHHVVDRASEANCPYAVLIVDEMQRLSARQFNAFTEPYDKLLRLHITLTVIFAGNDQESSSLLENIEQPQYDHIRGRFFTQGFTFKGLTGKDQVEGCLAQYDTLRYPEDGTTYTGYFLPEAVKNGWRLASLSGELWRVFHDYQSRYRIGSWGMQYFTATVNTLLTDFLPHHGIEQFDAEMVHECIRISGLVPSLVRPDP